MSPMAIAGIAHPRKQKLIRRQRLTLPSEVYAPCSPPLFEFAPQVYFTVTHFTFFGPADQHPRAGDRAGFTASRARVLRTGIPAQLSASPSAFKSFRIYGCFSQTQVLPRIVL